MSGTIHPDKTPRTALADCGTALELQRKQWLGEQPSHACLVDIDSAIAVLCEHLHVIDHDDAPHVEKRWYKLRQKLYPGIVWLAVIDRLQAHLPSSDLMKLAGPVERLSNKPLAQVEKCLGKKEWARTRRWWYGFSDALADDIHYVEVTEDRLNKAHHRIIKTRDRALKKSADVTWHKLANATNDIGLLIQIDAALGDADHQKELLAICNLVQGNLIAWRLSKEVSVCAKQLAISPELDRRNKLVERLYQFSENQILEAYRHLEVTRKLIVDNAFSL